MTPQEFSQVGQGIGYIFQALGIVAAAAFFGYKVWLGYHVINLSLSVKCDRQADPAGGDDYLSVQVHLEKGDRGTVTLHDARLRLGPSGQEVSLGGVWRSQRRPEKQVGAHVREVVVWDEPDPSFPLLNLTPGEKTVLAALCRVPAGTACVVEVCVLGRRRRGKPVFGQWKASAVSLPLPRPQG